MNKRQRKKRANRYFKKYKHLKLFWDLEQIYHAILRDQLIYGVAIVDVNTMECLNPSHHYIINDLTPESKDE